MSQSMGDRVNQDLPRFRSMSPGYSASGMFMAKIEGELRQVVKLSTAHKLKIELSKYKTYVRYKLVNAARIPSNALAFDTRGEDGRLSAINEAATTHQNKHYEAYGVLVSDLVSGGGSDNENVRTFLDLLAHAIGVPNAQNWPTLDTISSSIANVFPQVDKLWLLDKDKLSLHVGVLNAVKMVFHLPVGDNSDARRAQDLNDALSHFGKISGRSDVTLESLTERFSNGIITTTELEKILSIVHGDLNARNLTWADALNSFFLIDFESTGPGFRGADQFRLAINTVNELFGAWLQFRPSGKDNSIVWKELEAGITFFADLFGELTKSGSTPLHTLVKSHSSTTGASPESDAAIVKILASILETATWPDRGTDQESTSWRKFWAYVLLCSVLKEFEYSCRRVTKSIVEQLEMNSPGFSGALSEIHTKLRLKLAAIGANKEDEAYYIRHAVAARLLMRVSEKLRE